MVSLRAGLLWLLFSVLGIWLGGRFGLLVCLLVLAVATDLSVRKIPNLLVFPGMLAGLLSQWWLPEAIPLVSALKGMGWGFLLFFPLYLMRAMGAGDVKLMAMVGVFVGADRIFGAVLGTLVVGGCLALLVAIKQKAFARLLDNLKLMAFEAAGKLALGEFPKADASLSVGKLPYALAIAVGTVGSLAFQSG